VREKENLEPRKKEWFQREGVDLFLLTITARDLPPQMTIITITARDLLPQRIIISHHHLNVKR
jgi:hypothetical protein